MVSNYYIINRNNYFNLRCWLEAILINKDSFNRSLKDVFADIIKRVVIHSDDHNYTNEFLKQVDWAEISESFISDYEEEQEQ